ncbi:hypothetical protein N0V82_005347 [Gnomoniopsis sp. IMI 355080]|nr:hypothetical protein N0V82_005347 [Gnomoniopsis sp. IMI 355080]
MEPLFRALYLANPSFDIRSTHVVTDRNNLRKLLSFVNPSLGKDERNTFTMNIEIVNNTAIFCREETATQEYIAPHEFRGFGHEFEKAYTTCSLHDSTGHHRIISYHFGGLNLILRHETDGYLWVSQTPKLVRAYHNKGIFQQPQVEDVTEEINRWEEAHQGDLRRLAALIRNLLDMVKKCGGIATARYDIQGDKIVLQKANREKMLPEDLYLKWDDGNESKTVASIVDQGLGTESGAKPASGAQVTKVTYGNPNDTPFYDVINFAVETGFRHVFRRLPTQLTSYRLLCQTLESHAVDVLEGRTLRDIMEDMRRGKSDWDPEERREIRGCKSTARDSAFRLVYILLQGTFVLNVGDKDRAYNATEFVVSHSRIFRYRARKMVREAYAERFQFSEKQRKHLEKWSSSTTGSEETDVTTEEESLYLDSDDSDDFF